MEREQLKKLISDAFAAIHDENNRAAMEEIIQEYEPIVFLCKGLKIVCGRAFDVCSLVVAACMQDKDFHCTVKMAMEAIEEYKKEKSATTVQDKSAHTVQANA